MSSGISKRGMKLLWGNSALRCAMPDCQKRVLIDQTEKDPSSIVGEMAHIKGRNRMLLVTILL